MNAASEYRKRAVETASPVGLVVLLYGGVVTALMRAVAAVEANNVEKRVAELNRALNILSELQGTLNFEKGGEVARHLEKFYMVMRSQVLEASIKNSKPLLLELIAHVGSLKEAWEQVDRQQGTNGSIGLSGSAIPVVPPQNARPAVAAVR